VRRAGILILLSLFPSAGSSAVASLTDALVQTQSYLESRISPLVHRIDPDAMVFVKLVPRRSSAPLPLTPFILKDLPLQDGAELVLQRLDVVVLTDRADLGKETIRTIQEICRGFGPSPVIRIRPMPARPVVDAPPAAPPPEDWKTRLGTLFSSRLAVAAGIAGTSGAALVLLLLVALSLRGGTRAIGRDLGSAIGRVAAALETGGLDRERAAVGRTGRNTSVTGTTEFAARDSVFASLSEQSLLALLSDCYWGSFDGYAAFVWRRIPIPVKTALLQHWHALEEFVAHLVGMPEQDLGVDHEPYYLSPLPLWHIDSAGVTALVLKSPVLLYRISSLRRAGLELSTKQRVELTTLALAGKSTYIPEFANLPPSPSRRFRRNLKVNIQTIEEEAEVLKLPDLSPDLMESIPSLGWLSEMPKATIEEILRPFSAKELASAWIAPPDVLETLGACLAPKKLELLRSYVTHTPPSRGSEVFAKLHASAIARRRVQARILAMPAPETEVERKVNAG